ncbi:MAG TPA: DUF1302 family protein [Candidatus Binatia bacterium]|nr:DUF1302 family protein [Candidatus Binatia bacterium]
MSNRRQAWVVSAVVAAARLVLLDPPARATQKWGPLQLSGNVQSQNIVRTPDASTYEFIQNRNIAHIRLDYDWLQGGQFYNKYDIPFIESSHLFLLYRGVYDSIYDTKPAFLQKEDIHGRAYAGLDYFDYATQTGHLTRNQLNLNSLNAASLRFENRMREAYADVKLRGVPLTMRIGRQQVVWGESDNFRLLDRANPLDLTWHFQQEIPAPAFGWDEIRRPLLMFKFLYTLGNIGPLSQSFLEWYWNPGDWYPAKQAFLPQPWGLPIYNPLTNVVDGAFVGGPCDTVFNRAHSPVPYGPSAGQGMCTRLMNGTTLFKQGNYSRDPLDNSQVGVRYHGMTPFGVEFTLNYYYQRWAGDDGTNYAQLRALPDNPQNEALSRTLLNRGVFPAEFIAPYVHTIGGSATYSDDTYTQTVYRMETVFDQGIPFYDVSKVTVVDGLLPGVTKKNMWKGMIGFDRPTWIRSLNKKSTFFLTGQFFWHYLIDNPSCPAQNVAIALQNPQNRPATLAKYPSCLVGGLDLPSTVRTANVAFRDKIRDWESLFTLAGFTFYRGGSVVPVAGIAVDPVNQWSMEPFWDVDWILRDDFIVNLGQHYFVTPRGHSTPIFETWGLAGLEAGRSETVLRVTFQF